MKCKTQSASPKFCVQSKNAFLKKYTHHIVLIYRASFEEITIAGGSSL